MFEEDSPLLDIKHLLELLGFARFTEGLSGAVFGRWKFAFLEDATLLELKLSESQQLLLERFGSARFTEGFLGIVFGR